MLIKLLLMIGRWTVYFIPARTPLLGEVSVDNWVSSHPGTSQVALVVMNPPANAGDLRDVVPSLSWKDSLEEGMQPTQCSCLENPMDRGAWRAVVHGIAKSDWRVFRLFLYHIPLSLESGEEVEMVSPGKDWSTRRQTPRCGSHTHWWHRLDTMASAVGTTQKRKLLLTSEPHSPPMT